MLFKKKKKKKRNTWYKYANINKVIRNPPKMKNMPFGGENKKKTVLCTFIWGNWCWKKSLCPCAPLPAPKETAPPQHHFTLCCIHIFFCAENQKQTVAEFQTLKMEGWIKRCLLTTLTTTGRCFLRTSTGGAEGQHPKTKGIPSLSLSRTWTQPIYGRTLPLRHAFNNIRMNTHAWTSTIRQKASNHFAFLHKSTANSTRTSL